MEDVLNQGLLLSNDYSLYPVDINITSTGTISELLQRADLFYGNNLTALIIGAMTKNKLVLTGDPFCLHVLSTGIRGMCDHAHYPTISLLVFLLFYLLWCTCA